VITIATASGVAAYVALILGNVALYYFRFSCEQIRCGAIIAVILLVAALAAADLLCRKLRKGE
jgi:hypothetical protein